MGRRLYQNTCKAALDTLNDLLNPLSMLKRSSGVIGTTIEQRIWRKWSTMLSPCTLPAIDTFSLART